MSARADQRGRPVAVFDVGLPPGLAFIRSLGRAGVPVVAFSSAKHPSGRYSRYVDEFRRCPGTAHADVFVDWLTELMSGPEAFLIAPTSDEMAFFTAEARRRVVHAPTSDELGASIRACLFKPKFVEAMNAAAFPVPRSYFPTSTDEAVAFGRELGYPIVMKPRSHVGIGRARGTVVRSEDELRTEFLPFWIPPGNECVLAYDPDVAYPMLQQYLDPEHCDVISVTGCVAAFGEAVAVGHSRKTHQWPPRLGIGTMFESLPPQPFTGHALAAVVKTLRLGIFEFEVLVRRDDGRYWAIDLNPRAFGQISLDIAQSRDLPVEWYESMEGYKLPTTIRSVRSPRHWRLGVPFYAGALVDVARGPGRFRRFRHFANLLRKPGTGATMSWSDPLPALLHSLEFLRHPGGLIRPYLDRKDHR